MAHGVDDPHHGEVGFLGRVETEGISAAGPLRKVPQAKLSSASRLSSFHNQVFESINSAWTQEMETEGVALREGIDQEPSSPEGCRQSPLTALP